MKNTRPRAIVFLLFPLIVLTMGQGAVMALSADEERHATLVEGAKKERKVVFYTAMAVPESLALLRKFEEKYPFIKTELLAERGEKQVVRVIAETRAGKTAADVIQLGGFQVHLVKKAGVLLKYLSPENKFFPPGFKDPDGFWTDTFINTNVLAYNTKMISPKEAPKSFDDLLDPRWKNKLIMDFQEYEWFNIMLKVRGEEKGMDFMRKLGKQNINFRVNRALVAALVIAGEFPVAVSTYTERAEQFKRDGAPIEWVPVEPVVAKLHPMAITALAPHPNAAKLFVDYMLSKEGQTVFKNIGKMASRPDVESDIPRMRGIKLYPSDPREADNYNNVVKIYNSTFGIRK